MEPSPTNTVVDYDAVISANKAKSNNGSTGSEHDAALAKSTTRSDIPPLSQRRKWSLLMVFCLGFFIDIWMYSAFFVFTGPISEDLAVPFEQQTWVSQLPRLPEHEC